MGEIPNMIVAVPLSRSRHMLETNKTRYPWSRVQVFGRLKYPYPYPYPCRTLVRVRNQRMYMWLAQPYLVVSQCDMINLDQLNMKNNYNK